MSHCSTFHDVDVWIQEGKGKNIGLFFFRAKRIHGMISSCLTIKNVEGSNNRRTGKFSCKQTVFCSGFITHCTEIEFFDFLIWYSGITFFVVNFGHNEAFFGRGGSSFGSFPRELEISTYQGIGGSFTFSLAIPFIYVSVHYRIFIFYIYCWRFIINNDFFLIKMHEHIFKSIFRWIQGTYEHFMIRCFNLKHNSIKLENNRMNCRNIFAANIRSHISLSWHINSQKNTIIIGFLSIFSKS